MPHINRRHILVSKILWHLLFTHQNSKFEVVKVLSYPLYKLCSVHLKICIVYLFVCCTNEEIKLKQLINACLGFINQLLVSLPYQLSLLNLVRYKSIFNLNKFIFLCFSKSLVDYPYCEIFQSLPFYYQNGKYQKYIRGQKWFLFWFSRSCPEIILEFRVCPKFLRFPFYLKENNSSLPSACPSFSTALSYSKALSLR